MANYKLKKCQYNFTPTNVYFPLYTFSKRETNSFLCFHNTFYDSLPTYLFYDTYKERCFIKMLTHLKKNLALLFLASSFLPMCVKIWECLYKPRLRMRIKFESATRVNISFQRTMHRVKKRFSWFHPFG